MMSFPGVIERPLLADELSIYLDNTQPIPLSALASFLSKIDKEAQAVEGMRGLFLELSDFALGSNEVRLRIVGPGRLAREEAARQERLVAAAEGATRAGKISAGAAVASAVAAVVALAINTGAANPASYRIVKQYHVQNIYVRAPHEAPHIITNSQIEHARQTRLSSTARSATLKRDAESAAILSAMRGRQVVDLAGWVHREKTGGYFLETMNGNRFPVHFSHDGDYDSSPLALRTIVHDSHDGLHLEVIEPDPKLS